MKITKGKIILAIVVVYFAIFAVINVNKNKELNEVIKKEVTIVTNGKINKKNEGKLVLLVGKISYDGKVEFKELDNGIDSFKVTRKVEDFKNYTSPGGSKGTKWVEREKPLYNEDEIDTEYTDSLTDINILSTLYTETKTLDTKVGEFKIDELGMNKIKNTKLYNKQESISNLSWTGLFYSNPDHEDNDEVGDVRITYSYFDTSKTKYLTVLAQQSNDSFVPYKLNGTEVYTIYEGKVDTLNKLDKELKNEVKKTGKGKILFILMILGIGIFFIVDAKKKS